MKTKKLNKKGFTLVELVVVVAVIAVLSAILIPTIGCFVEQAKETNDMATVRLLNVALVEDEAENGKPATMTEALAAMNRKGYDIEKLNPRSTGEIFWDGLNNRFALYNKDGNPVYLDNSTAEPQKINLWKIVETEDENGNPINITLDEEYSHYLKGENYVADQLTVKTGLDVGNNTGINAIRYENTSATAKNVIIRTNGITNLDINGYVDSTDKNKGDVIKHYGEAGNVNVIKCAMASYHEFGSLIGNITLKEGHVSLEENSKVNSLIIDANDIEQIAITQGTSADIQGTIIALNDSIKNALKTSENIKVNENVLSNVDNVELISSGISLADFIEKLSSGKQCVLSSNIELNGEMTFTQKNIDLDLNGFELKVIGSKCPISLYTSAAKIYNGKIALKSDSVYSATIYIKDGSKLEMVGVNYEAINSSGIFPDDKSELIVRNSSVKAAVYGLGTNASNAQVNSPVINISIYDSSFKTETADNDNTALYINVPVVAYFENTSFVGGRQAVFVRGGTATFKNCSLTTSGNYSNINQYYDTTWGSGNEIPVAAITIGNRSTSAYDYPVTVTLISTKLFVENNAENIFALYAYGETKSNYTVSISYDSNCVLGRTNLNDSIGNVTISLI